MMTGPWPKQWVDPQGRPFLVYPTAYQGVLNHGLTARHAQLGLFPTAESLEIRKRRRGEKTYDELSLVDMAGPGPSSGGIPRPVNGGLQVAGLHAVCMNAGETLYRFGDEGHHRGGWWVTRESLFRILLRVEPKQEGLPGVRGGADLNIRDYARRYNEVLTEWSMKKPNGNRMRYLFATQLRGRVMVFRGMGAAQRSEEVLDIPSSSNAPQAVSYERMADDNRQVFIPNIHSRIDGAVAGEPPFFAPVVKWHPEVLERCLVPLIKQRIARGDTYRAIITDVETWMMRGDRRALFGGLTPPPLSG